MIETQFTPGPWEAHTFSLSTSDRRLKLAHFGPITGLFNRADSTRQSEANCLLAAAAPDMYEGCMKAAAQFRFYEQQHRAKKTPEADEKAQVNRRMAEELEAICDKARGVQL